MKYELLLHIGGIDEHDVLHLDVQAEGEGFRGATQCYTNGATVLAWADELAHFRGQPGETVRFGDGPDGTHTDFGANLFAADRLGHWAMRMRLALHLQFPASASHYLAEIEIGVEPQALDRFVLELRELVRQRSGAACLKGRDRG